MASSAPTSSATATTILLKSNPVHHTNAEWISNRESIKQLYLVEKLSLTNLRREMEDRYGFHAS